MDKIWYQSKTIWGFGLAGLIMLLQTLGILDQTTLLESLKILTGLFGAYGLRASIK